MSGTKRFAVVAIALAVLGGMGVGIYALMFDVTTVTEYRDPKTPDDEVFTDDKSSPKELHFDAELVDSRELAGWQVNSSAAVLRLDCPPFRPKQDKILEMLYPSYTVAARAGGPGVLPSVNIVDGKAKQFDDGMYAALDLAAFKGIEKQLAGCRDIVKRLADKVKPGTPAAAYLEAALALASAGAKGAPAQEPSAAAKALIEKFQADANASKPIGFYAWNDELGRLWKVERFLSAELEPAVAADLAAALKSDAELLADYRKFTGLFRRLSNPLANLALDEVPDGALTKAILSAEAGKRGLRHATVSFLPPSSCRESELAERLQLPATANLMREFMKRIRSGEIDLKPGKDAGWYDYQVYALETLLVPQKGQEKDKLLLSARYKQRMQEAFEALLTKRRETHSRSLPAAKCEAPIAPRPSNIAPRLRIEPAPSYFLRTARAYSFVGNFLRSQLGEDALKDIYGLRFKETPGTLNKKMLTKVSERDDPLGVELSTMRDLFYGFYLVSCEDIGLRPELLAGEVADQALLRTNAENWLANCGRDPDLAADTRVSVPVIHDGAGTQLWATLGVRLTRFKASYDRSPSIRHPGGEWERANDTAPAEYLLPVDTFVSFRLKGNRVLDRDELRELITKAGTRDEFLKLVSQQ